MRLEKIIPKQFRISQNQQQTTLREFTGGWNVLDDDIPVHGVLCFVEADWPLIGGAFTTCGVEVLWPKKLYPILQATGSLQVESLAEIHRALASALPVA